MKETEEVIAVMESLSSIIPIDEEYVMIQEVVQNLESLVDVCLVQHKQVDACLQGTDSPCSFF